MPIHMKFKKGKQSNFHRHSRVLQSIFKFLLADGRISNSWRRDSNFLSICGAPSCLIGLPRLKLLRLRLGREKTYKSRVNSSFLRLFRGDIFTALRNLNSVSFIDFEVRRLISLSLYWLPSWSMLSGERRPGARCHLRHRFCKDVRERLPA